MVCARRGWKSPRNNPDSGTHLVRDGGAGARLVKFEQAVERQIVPYRYKNYRMFSWGFTISRTDEQLYAEWSGKPVNLLNYS